MLDTVLALLHNPEQLITYAQEYQWFLVTLLVLSSSELATHFLGVLVGSGKISYSVVFIILATLLTYDICVYWIVWAFKKSKFNNNRFLRSKAMQKFSQLYRAFEKRTEHNPYLILLLLKFLPISKITIIFYIYHYQKPFRIFVLEDIAAICIWLSILFNSGIIAGAGILSVSQENTVKNILLYGMILFLALCIFKKDLNSLLVKGSREEQQKK